MAELSLSQVQVFGAHSLWTQPHPQTKGLAVWRSPLAPLDGLLRHPLSQQLHAVEKQLGLPVSRVPDSWQTVRATEQALRSSLRSQSSAQLRELVRRIALDFKGVQHLYRDTGGSYSEMRSWSDFHGLSRDELLRMFWNKAARRQQEGQPLWESGYELLCSYGEDCLAQDRLEEGLKQVALVAQTNRARQYVLAASADADPALRLSLDLLWPDLSRRLLLGRDKGRWGVLLISNPEADPKLRTLDQPELHRVTAHSRYWQLSEPQLFEEMLPKLLQGLVGCEPVAKATASYRGLNSGQLILSQRKLTFEPRRLSASEEVLWRLGEGEQAKGRFVYDNTQRLRQRASQLQLDGRSRMDPDELRQGIAREAVERLPLGSVLGQHPASFVRRLASAQPVSGTPRHGCWSDPTALESLACYALPSGFVHRGLEAQTQRFRAKSLQPRELFVPANPFAD